MDSQDKFLITLFLIWHKCIDFKNTINLECFQIILNTIFAQLPIKYYLCLLPKITQMKKVISIFFVLLFGLMFIYSCDKEDRVQNYSTYKVEYLLTNKMNEGKRFIITYKNPEFANTTTEQYESILDTFWIRFDAKSLDYLYLAGITRNDYADYSISIYVDSKLVVIDSTSCDWECDSTMVEIAYPLP